MPDVEAIRGSARYARLSGAMSPPRWSAELNATRSSGVETMPPPAQSQLTLRNVLDLDASEAERRIRSVAVDAVVVVGSSSWYSASPTRGVVVRGSRVEQQRAVVHAERVKMRSCRSSWNARPVARSSTRPRRM